MAATMETKKTTKKKKKGKMSKKRLRRIRRIKRALICVGAALIAAAVFFALNWALIGGRLYPIGAKALDLSGQGLTGVGQISRLRRLETLDLSQNAITDVSPLRTLTACRYMDLTGNPVSEESCQALKNALPDCVILAEARDDSTTSLALGGFELPGVETLESVFSSMRYLTQVDLRATNLSEADVSRLREALPHVNFISGGDFSGRTIINANSYQEAASALSSLEDVNGAAVLGYAFTPSEYRELLSLYPGADIDCLINLYGKSVSCGVASIDLTDVTADDTLYDNLLLLSNLREASLGNIRPTQAERIRSGLGLESMTYRFNGRTVSDTADNMDLRGRGNVEREELEALMRALPAVKEVWLDEPDETVLEVIAPYRGRVSFYYDTEILGRKYSTAAERIDLGDTVTDGSVDELLQALKLFPNLEEVYMYDSELSQQSMDRMFEERDDLFFGWTIHMCRKKYNLRTDATAFSTLIGAPMNYYTQNDLYQLRYCRKLKGLDLGHNAITDISFIKYMPELRVLILADNDLTDISPLASLEELEYLEVFMNYHLTDYSPLSGLKNLKDLNIRVPGSRKLTITADDFMPIKSLERFWGTARVFSKEEVARLEEAVPQCEVCVTDTNSTDEGWRDNEKYKIIKRMFQNGVYEEPFE